jgi:polyhydroxyalkanoate synthesis regulator phasin
MVDDEEFAALRRSLTAIANALADRAALVRALVDELMTGMVQKGLFTDAEMQAISQRALEQREKQRSEYRIPEGESAVEKLAKLHDALTGDIIDLTAIRAKLEKNQNGN